MSSNMTAGHGISLSYSRSGDSFKSGYAPLHEDEETFQEMPKMEYNHPYPPNSSRITSLPSSSRRTRVGFIIISAGFIGAAVLAVVNHIVFYQLNGTVTGNHTRQFWITLVQNAFPTAISIVLLAALNCCLLQVALYRIRLSSHSLALVSLMTSPPDSLTTLLILCKSRLRLSVLGFVFLGVITQSSLAFTSVFVPGSLTITSSPARPKLISVPTIDLNLVDRSESAGNAASNDGQSAILFSTPSQRWQQLITRAATTNIAPTWDPPADCGIACTYKFKYSAPALNCTPLSQQDIWPNNQSSSDSSNGLAFPLIAGNTTPNEYFMYNASYSVEVQPTGVVSFNNSALQVYYLEGFNSTTLANSLANGTQPDISPYSALGAFCTFQSATYEATTSFANNSQTSSTNVTAFSGPLPFEPKDGTFNSTLAGLSIAYIYGELFSGNVSHNSSSGTETTSTQALLTPLFNLTSVVLGPNTTDGYFSLSQRLHGDIAQGLQDLLANVTLSLVNEHIAFTPANAMVTPATTEYVYQVRRLVISYVIVFAASTLIVILGLSSLHANDITATFDLEQILEMTANSSGLHELAVLPKFDEVPVKGRLVMGGHGLTQPVLDVDREKKEV